MIQSDKGKKKNFNPGILFLALGIFAWSTIEITITLIKNENTTPITINILRMLIGGLTLFIIIILTGRLKQLIGFIKKYPKYYIPAALIGLVLGQIIYIEGTRRTTPELAATIFSSNPIIISLYMMLKGGEERKNLRIIGVILGFIGVFLIITEFRIHDLFASDLIVGNLLVFFGMSLWTVDVIIGKLIFNRNDTEGSVDEYIYDSLDFNAVTFLFAGISMLPLLFIKSERIAIISITERGWWGILWLGVITGGLGYWFFFKGLESIDASKGINAFYFKPFIATFLSYFIFGINPDPTFWIGLFIEVVALYMVSYKGKEDTSVADNGPFPVPE